MLQRAPLIWCCRTPLRCIAALRRGAYGCIASICVRPRRLLLLHRRPLLLAPAPRTMRRAALTALTALTALAALAGAAAVHDAAGAQDASAAAAAAGMADAARRAEVAATAIQYLPYDVIVARLQALAAAAPDFVQVWNAQSRYGVASPGRCRRGTPAESDCQHWFVTLTDTRNASGAACNAARVSPDTCLSHRPQVFFSGNLHGDEVVGPMTLLLLLEDLVALALRGDNPWVRWLLGARYIVAIPVTNPAGYDAGVREENYLDPNRDFPYAQAADQCMRTTVARAVNEVWRDHIFRAAVTFHGGMQAIAYEWGAPNHAGHDSESPDDVAQRAVGSVMREAAGAFAGDKYPVNRLNLLVYAVPGGMEDWGYAGSWDTAATVVCTPTTYGGYPPEKTQYSAASLRAFNVLVETSDAKRPAEEALGLHPPLAGGAFGAPPVGWSVRDVFAVQGAGDGHVPRNMRLALAVIDLADPYVRVTRVTALPVNGGGSGGGALRALRFAAAARLPPSARYRGGVALAAADDSAPHDAALARKVDDMAALTAAQGDAWRALQATTRFAARRNLDAAAAPAAPRGVIADDTPYLGPPTCVAASADASATCTAHAAQYTQWLAVEAPNDATLVHGGVSYPAAALRLAVAVGWDVGGAVAVDATSTLVGSWDPRIPPSFFADVPVGSMTDASLSADAVPPSAVAALRAAAPALSDDEARTAALYIRGWQLVASGRVAARDLPAMFLLRHATPAAGVTRWVFGDLGTQPAPIAPGARRAGSQFADRQLGAAGVAGAPDMAEAPFVTRFEDCFVVAPPALLDAAAAAPTAPAGCMRAAGQSRRRATVAGGAAASTDAARAAVAVDAYIVLPYAAVDGAWAQQGSPEPAGVPPQSHMVNARTRADWRHEHNGFVVQGRLQTAAAPVFVAVATRGTGVTDAALCEVASTGTRPVVQLASAAPAPAAAAAADGDTVIAGLGVRVGVVVQVAAGMTGVALALFSALALVWFRSSRAAAAGWQRLPTPDSGAPGAVATVPSATAE